MNVLGYLALTTTTVPLIITRQCISARIDLRRVVIYIPVLPGFSIVGNALVEAYEKIVAVTDIKRKMLISRIRFSSFYILTIEIGKWQSDTKSKVTSK